MRNLISAVAFATTLTGVGSASAQPYPSRPITMVTPFAAGGGTDTIARAMAERMKSSLGQPIIVEDVTGAGGTIAAGRVARAAPDGYTLSLGNNSSHIVPGAVFALQYDLQKDFEPVALLSTGPYVLAARKTMPANDLVGLIGNRGKSRGGGTIIRFSRRRESDSLRACCCPRTLTIFRLLS
jgi:tripartite-type tricarboxylate transporter receptor subunit TctC